MSRNIINPFVGCGIWTLWVPVLVPIPVLILVVIVYKLLRLVLVVMVPIDDDDDYDDDTKVEFRSFKKNFLILLKSVKEIIQER